MNWFKRKEKVDSNVSVKESNYPDVVVQIHKEFHSAGEKLLLEAQEVLEKAKSDSTEKGKRMLSLGFKQAREAAQVGEVLQKAATSEEVAKLVQYYQVNYPNNKFITEEQVQAICFKYNLICGEVGRYKGFVPEKNLRDIENFKVKEKDLPTLVFDVICDREKIPLNQIDDSFFSTYGVQYFSKPSSMDFAYITDGSAKISLGGTALFNEKCAIFDGKRFVKAIKKQIRTLQICAPVKDMDLTGMTIADGYKMIQHIPDPVVLQHVRGGYLIITAWGDEASDENVVNQAMN